MSERRRVYLDHAATSWPKSPTVLEAMNEFVVQCGAAAGRGGYHSAAQADQIVALARRRIATMIGAETSECISLHANGTAALNAAIHGVVRKGDHVVTSAAEHNSVLRPLHHLKSVDHIELTVIETDSDGFVDVDAMIGSIRPETRLVTLTHASNVAGTVQPIEVVGNAVRETSTLFLCDAAQTFGAIPIDVSAAAIDLLAAPGHKCSGGPLGTAFLYVADSIHGELVPSVQGGTGSQSESLEMPTQMPTMLEAGNLNVPAIAGWSEAIREIQGGDWNQRRTHGRDLAQRLREGLASIDHLRIFGHQAELPIASVGLDGLAPTDASAILDVEFGIETRAGMHCAALIHHHLGSQDEGTLRISAGPSSTTDDIDCVIDALSNIVRSLHSH